MRGYLLNVMRGYSGHNDFMALERKFNGEEWAYRKTWKDGVIQWMKQKYDCYI